MSAQANREAFFREVDALRHRGEFLDPVDVAQCAVRAGLSTKEALLQIQNYTYRHMRSGDLVEALAVFVSSLCEMSKEQHLLEYICFPSILTLRFVEKRGHAPVTYLTPDQRILELLRVLLSDSTSSVNARVADIPKSAEFDAIVCSPPLGRSSTTSERADGFGGEIVMELAPFLAEGGKLYWVTGRGALFAARGKATLSALLKIGLYTEGVIDVAPGGFPGTMIEGAVIALGRKVPTKKFVGALRDLETAEPLASAFLAGPSRRDGPNWAWLDGNDPRAYSEIEHDRLLQKLMPRGHHTPTELRSLLVSERVERADKPVQPEEQQAAFVFVPEYAGSRVTADLDEQTVKPKAIYRLSVNPSKANPRFLAQILNGPYGKHLRASAARGATIQRMSVDSLLALILPIPNLATQDRIARLEGDIGLLQTTLEDMKGILDHEWTAIAEATEKIDRLKGVLDIERQIAEWWRELPYPLATIYRRYQVSTEPKERLDTLLHFFEMAAIYLAAIGTSHVRAMRKDWQEVLAKWFHPSGAAGIERADFGFWNSLARASLKDMNRIVSDKELRTTATDIAGPELVEVAATIGTLGKTSEVLDVARQHRNRSKGHSGLIKASDAARLDRELQQSVRDLYEISASAFRRLQLVRPGMAEITDTSMRFTIEVLSGSDPTFAKEQVELDRSAKSNALAFWMKGARTMCRAIPFFRLGAPQQPRETSFYVFNRVENGGFRWISYQEAREQEFVASDDELFQLIALGSAPK